MKKDLAEPLMVNHLRRSAPAHIYSRFIAFIACSPRHIAEMDLLKTGVRRQWVFRDQGRHATSGSRAAHRGSRQVPPQTGLTATAPSPARQAIDKAVDAAAGNKDKVVEAVKSVRSSLQPLAP